MVGLNFDASQVAPSVGGEPVPEGWYAVMIDESEAKPTKDATEMEPWMRLNIRFNVIEGPFQGRKIYTGLNLRNKSAQAMEIAYKELSAICHACGRLQVNDSQELHGIPLRIKVRIRKDPTGQYSDQNNITSYKNINDVIPELQGANAGFGAPPAGGFAAPPAGAVPNNAQPWQQPAPQGFQPPQQPQQFQQPQFQPPPQQYAQPQPVQQYAPQGGNGQYPIQPAPQQAPPQQTFAMPPTQAFVPPQQTAPQAPPVQQAAPQQPPQQTAQPGQAPAGQHPAQQAAPPWSRPAGQ